MKFKENKNLFQTIVGSHMWDMNHKKSDIDYYKCYIADSRSILLGNRHNRGHQGKGFTENGTEFDISSFEIGHIINQLMKGNVNHIWGVMSSEVVYTSEEHKKLKKLIEENPSKQIMFSVRGLSIHNLHHWFGIKMIKEDVWKEIPSKKGARFEKNTHKYKKKLNLMGRTLHFGINLLLGKGFKFEKVETKNPEEIIILINTLQTLYDYGSKLPKNVDSEPFLEFLLKLRLNELEGMLNGYNNSSKM